MLTLEEKARVEAIHEHPYFDKLTSSQLDILVLIHDLQPEELLISFGEIKDYVVYGGTEDDCLQRETRSSLWQVDQVAKAISKVFYPSPLDNA